LHESFSAGLRWVMFVGCSGSGELLAG
jgi:hypothetical protein